MEILRQHSLPFLALLGLMVLCSCQDKQPLSYYNVARPEFTTAYPGVVLVYGRGSCSGVRIGTDTVLTSFHCVQSMSRVSVVTSGARYMAEVLQTLGNGATTDPHDLAVLRVAESAPDEVIPIGRQASVGEPVRLVGYGCDEKNIYGKRTGTNRITNISTYLEITSPILNLLKGTQSQAAGCEGDSGSPLLQESTGGYKVIGITHSATEGAGEVITQYSDLTRADHRAFLQQAIQNFRLKVPAF